MAVSIPQDWKDSVEKRIKNPTDIGKFFIIAKEYTGNGNVYLNQYLREQDALTTDGERNEHTQKFPIPEERIWSLYNALIDLRVEPPSSNITLYRGLPNKIVSHLKEGDIYRDAGFSSFSFSPYVAISFAREVVPTILVFKNPKEGVWFSHLGEYEFVIGPRCLFHIDSIHQSMIASKNCNVYEISFIDYHYY